MPPANMPQFETSWSSAQQNRFPPHMAEGMAMSPQSWEEQFQDFTISDQGTSSQAFEALDNAWKNAHESLTVADSVAFEEAWQGASVEQSAERWAEEFGLGDNIPKQEQNYIEKEYVFEPVNPYLTHEDPLAEALRLKQNGESLSATALAFEAAVQRDLQNSEAWGPLGLVQAENEKEEAAIIALEHAVKLNPGHTNALMALSVSYTNEGLDFMAFKTLAKWFQAKYPEMTAGAFKEDLSSIQLYNVLNTKFLEAAKIQADGGMPIDADTQVGLGILSYNAGQYDKSIDCFKTALSINPADYLLWNRLGATLANSGRSEEAIDAYFHALDQRPGFVRCRYNLGVSCMNVGCYKEAAEHFLSALKTHEVQLRNSEGVSEDVRMVKEPTNIWETLKRCFILMDRRDLLSQCDARSINAFKPEFEF